MLEELKNKICEIGRELDRFGLVSFTEGNISAVDRRRGLVAIKPSGVACKDIQPESVVIVDLSGKRIEGTLKQSVDTETHTVLYNEYSNIGSIIHTNSEWATVWAQAGKSIPAYGTVHASFAMGAIPCTRALTKAQVKNNYEENTGNIICQFFREFSLNPNLIPAVLIHSRGPFVWGKDCDEALRNAVLLEKTARMAWHTQLLSNPVPMDTYMLEKHYRTMHGENDQYGQRDKRLHEYRVEEF